MPTDDERLAVARRLRRSRSEWSGMGWRLWLGPKFCAVVLSDGNRDELEDAAHLLADLIDQDCGTREADISPVPGHNADLSKMVDRDALLALAGKLDKDAVNIISAARNAQFTGGGPTMEEAKHDAYEWRQIARSIREALGVEA